MPFEVAESINYVSEKFTGFPIVNTIISNPFYTALLIVIIVVLMTLFVFRDVDFEEDQSLIKLSLRNGAYMLIIVTGILFLHNKNIMREVRETRGSSEMKEIFDNPVRGGVVTSGGKNNIVSADYGNNPGLTDSIVSVISTKPDFTAE